MNTLPIFVALTLTVLSPPALAGPKNPPATQVRSKEAPPPAVARAELAPKSGTKTMGVVDFTETRDGLKIEFKLTGLNEGKEYGFYIHERGDCSAPDASSAGKRIVPVASKGGSTDESPEKHAGDLAPIVPEKGGEAAGSTLTTYLSVNKRNPVLGKAIVLHGQAQGTDKPPQRLACGSIRPLSVGVQ